LDNRNAITANIYSEYLVLYPDGTEMLLNDAKKVGLEPLLLKHVNRILGTSPSIPLASLEYVQTLGWVKADTNADQGHFRYYPAGFRVFELIRIWLNQQIQRELQAEQIKTPYFFDWQQDELRSQVETFHDRLYYVINFEQDRKFFLRFGADPGLFSFLQDIQLSHQQLPLRIYEYIDGFRYNQSGELRGIHRARAFSFFDIHSICATMDDAWAEYRLMYDHHVSLSQQLKMPYTVEFTVVKPFFENNKWRLLEIVRSHGMPVIVEVLSGAKHYWPMKHVFYDRHGLRYFNTQLDTANAERYNLHYQNAQNESSKPMICHTSLGSIERWIIINVENALETSPSSLPLWLCPTQVRIIPVNETFISPALELAKKLNQNHIRTDVDDRKKTVGRKLRFAHEQWLPIMIVFGQDEVDTGVYKLNLRTSDELKFMIYKELINYIKEQCEGYPTLPLGHPLVSRQVKS